MNRRDLLKLGAAALVSAGVAGRLFAAPTSGPRFLLVFLRGGYDSTNLLIPYSSSFYYEARPEHRDSPGPIRRRTPARSRWMPTGRWRPRCATRSARCISSGRWHSSRLPAPTICRAVTSRPRTASNSVSPPTARATTAPDFSAASGRYLERFGSGRQRPSPSPMRCRWCFEGAATVPNLSLKSVGKPPFDERQARILSDMYAGHHLEAAVERRPGAAAGSGAGDGG